jgi:hypothetical protein
MGAAMKQALRKQRVNFRKQIPFCAQVLNAGKKKIEYSG